MIKITDCTLRDGGYYTNWNFDADFIRCYSDCINHLPVYSVELGYLNHDTNDKGCYYNLSVCHIEQLSQMFEKEICVMIDTKICDSLDIKKVDEQISAGIDCLRFATKPTDFQKVIDFISKLETKNIKYVVNFMYFSELQLEKSFLEMLKKYSKFFEVINFVDSYGASFPQMVTDKLSLIRNEAKVQIGFHAHNNLEMALANSLASLDVGATHLDSTMFGIGRGAGNLKTELILLLAFQDSLNDKALLHLCALIEKMHDMQCELGWGTNLSYMFSAIKNYPQGKAMDLVVNLENNLEVIKQIQLNVETT